MSSATGSVGEIETKDFDRSRLYWKQYERENGKPAYVPIGIDSIRTSLNQTDVAVDEPPTTMTAEVTPADKNGNEDAIVSSPDKPAEVLLPADVLLRDDWHEFLLPKAPPMRPQVQQDPVAEPAWKADWHRVVMQRP